MRLLLASGNAHKLDELRRLLGPIHVTVVTPADIGGLPEVIEDRETFVGNAAKKATAGALASGIWTLADDSGLEVEALAGAPGVRSARYAAAGGDAANMAKLLTALNGVPAERRGARFVCSLALARPDGEIVASIDGFAAGRILTEARGSSGFGYDPLFLFAESDSPEAGRTFAELSDEEKGRVSHRGRALRELAQRLPHLLTGTDAQASRTD